MAIELKVPHLPYLTSNLSPTFVSNIPSVCLSFTDP